MPKDVAVTLPACGGGKGGGPARLVAAATCRVRPRPERPFSPDRRVPTILDARLIQISRGAAILHPGRFLDATRADYQQPAEQPSRFRLGAITSRSRNRARAPWVR